MKEPHIIVNDPLRKENDDLKLKINGMIEERKRTEEAFRAVIKKLREEVKRLRNALEINAMTLRNKK